MKCWRVLSLMPATLLLALSMMPTLSMANPTPIEAAPTASRRIDPHKIPYVDQIVVIVRPDVEPPCCKPLPPALVEEFSRLAGVRLKYERNHDGRHLLRLPKKGYEAEGEALCKKILTDARVKECGPNYMVIGDSTTNPNDPIFSSGQQWNLRSESPAGINAVSAWTMTSGSASTVVAIVDGGIIPHADISASRLVAGYDFIVDPAVSGDGNGRDSNPADPGDWSNVAGCNATSSWHGTAVAGIIGATTDNNLGMAGINQAAKLLPVRVFGKCKKGNSNDLIDGMTWAAGIAVSGAPTNANPAKILNVSVSGAAPCSSTPGLQSAIDAIRKKGVVIVVSAGNDDGADVSQRSPASCSGVITVGSVTRFGGKGTTTIGPRIDIAAPGAAFGSAAIDMIPSTGDSGTQGPVSDNAILGYAGTSFAAPHVTGIVSLMLGVRPALRPDQIVKIIKKTARPFPTGTGTDCTTSTCGAGMLDGAAVVAAAKARISGGQHHTASLKSDGTVWTWGYNGDGQLSGGAVGAVVNAPVQLAGLAGMSSVSAGSYHTVSVKQDGTVWSWGYNANGRLGNGNTTQQPAPVQVNGLTNVAEVIAGDSHTLALKHDGTVWAWGYNFFGQLGAGAFDFTDRTTPVQVMGLTNVVAIAAGGKGSMALKADGTVWVWGNYKLKLFSTLPPDWASSGGASGPYPVAGLTNVLAIAAGGNAVTGNNADVCLALTADGQFYSWGSNDWGELGLGTVGDTTAKGVPTLVSALSGKTILNMATSGYHVVALTDDGHQWTWGLGNTGQLGDGVSGNEPGYAYYHYSALPINAAIVLTNVLDVAVGSGFTMALNADLTYSAWGANDSGQLGTGNTTDLSNPAPILGAGATGVYTALNASTVQTDLSVNLSSVPNPAVAGQNVTYALRITNLGTVSASNVRATVILPAQASFVSADAGCVYSANLGGITCAVGSLDAASSVTRNVVASIATAGTYEAVASTAFDGTDSATASNVAGTQTTVSAAASGDVPIPLWALGALGAGLLSVIARPRKRSIRAPASA